MPPKELSKIRIKLILPEKNSKMDGAESYEHGAILKKKKKMYQTQGKSSPIKKKEKASIIFFCSALYLYQMKT